MINRITYRVLSLVLGGLVCCWATTEVFAQQSKYHKEIERTTEEKVEIRLESAYGNVTIARGKSNKILIADMIADPSLDLNTDITYRIINSIGKLNLGLKPPERQRRAISLGSGDAGIWTLLFSDQLPLNFRIELGAGRGNFDFSGLRVNNLQLSAGASAVSIKFDEPNPEMIEQIKIESGVSRFTGESLSNANFKNLIFQGGVGSYTLDFGGELRHEANVKVDLGLGAVTIVVPKEIGVKLIAQQRWFSSVDVTGDFIQVRRNEQVSENYERAEGKLNIKVDSGMGSVRLRHE